MNSSLFHSKTLRLSIIVISANLIPSAWAQTWDGGGGIDTNWSTAANWAADTLPVFGSNPSITLTGASNYASNADAAVTLTKLTFNPAGGSASLTGSDLTFLAGATGSTQLILVGSGTSAGNVTIGNNLTLLGTGSITASTRNLTLNGNLALTSGNVQLNSNASQSITVNGIISGTTSLTYTGHSAGGGRFFINTSNTYTGPTSIWTGGVVIGVDALTTGGAFGADTSTVQLGINSGSSTFTPSLLTGAAVTMARDVRVVTGTTATITATLGGNSAHTSIFSGNITLGTDNVAGNSLKLTAVSGGRVNVTGNLLRASGATGTTDAVTKTGAGIVAIEGSGNTYQGATTVSAGTLLINGVLSSGGAAVSVASGATFGGTGSANRDVNIADGAIFSPGNMATGGSSLAGTFATVGNVSFANTSILNFDLGLTSDTVSVTGNLTLDGVLNISDSGGLAPGMYSLFSYTGTFINNGLTLNTLPSGYTYALNTSTAGLVSLQVIPEPQTFALTAGGIALGLVLIRRRSSRKIAAC